MKSWDLFFKCIYLFISFGFYFGPIGSRVVSVICLTFTQSKSQAFSRSLPPSGNWGVQDQRASMKWVQKYAAAFGGDPSRITIFGESAGAGSVAFHLAAPRSYDQSAQESSTIPLFRASMMESGNLAAPWNSQNMSYAEKKLTAVAVNLGCLPEGSLGPVSDNATV